MMKGIKDYFLNPQNKVEEDHKASQNVEGNQNKNDQVKKKHKRKKKRKPSDPAVKDVTQLLSDSLKFSPNSSSQRKRLSLNDSATTKLSETNSNKKEESTVMKESKSINARNGVIKESKLNAPNNSFYPKQIQLEGNFTITKPSKASTESESSSVMKENTLTEDGVIKSNKLNAFQLMMDRRNKSIGMNSPGKELDENSSVDHIENKEILAARRDLFLNWSDEKGASKRKRLEEEKDEIIKKKLKVRAKRFKKILKVDCDEVIEKKKEAKKKKIIKIASSSPDSDSNFEEKQTKEINKSVRKKRITLKDKLKPEVKHNDSSSSSCDEDFEPVKKKTDKRVKSSARKVDNSEVEIENVEEISLENVPLATDKNSKSAEKGKYTGRKSRNNNDNFESKKLTPLDGKRKSGVNSKLESKKTDNLEREFECGKSTQEVHTKIIETPRINSSRNKETQKQGKVHNSIKNKRGNILDFIKLEKSKEINIDVEVEDNFDVEILEEINSEAKRDTENENVTKETETKKHVRKSRRKRKKSTKSDISVEDINQDSFVEEARHQESVFTPRTLRSWKMRIKINTDEDGTNLESTLSREKKPVDYAESSDTADDDSDAVLLSSDGEDVKVVKTPKKPLKVAPIFIKSAPKPKEDPAIVEARKQFLMSGIPSSLKKTIERQNSFLEQQHNVFPVTQHIQQICDSRFWNLPYCAELNLIDTPSLQQPNTELKCENLTKRRHVIRNINIDTEVKKVDDLKVLLNKIKAKNPNYPVYKSFRQIHEKSGRKTNVAEEAETPEKRKRGGKKKDKKKSKANIERAVSVQKMDSDSVEYGMWTEKYKPKSSEDIMGNNRAINRLKKWLEGWKNFSQEINSKRRRQGNGSESEFETTDCDSRDSSKLPGKIVVLGGPCGSGKSTAVYAICNDLGFNVIELNASSKRTGKRLLQKIQEATQSHQVRKGESQSSQNYFQSNSPTAKNESSSEQQCEKKMCVLLIEDIDIVFEQDDGFINGLMQLTGTSKRPIIATTTDYSSVFVQKFFGHFEYIPFSPLSSFWISTWLQIVSLVEGLYVSRDAIGTLLDSNKGDVRKTLLQLQFWVQSGGQLQHNQTFIKIEHKRNSCDEQSVAEDDPHCDSFIEDDSVFEHTNCIRSFEILNAEEPFKVPFYLDLGLLWWNIPNRLNLPNFSEQRLDDNVANAKNSTEVESDGRRRKNDKEQILSIGKLYDALSHVDVIFRKNYFDSGGEPSIGSSVVCVKDSLELCETFIETRNDLEFVHELTHSLVNGRVKNCSTVDDEECRLNVSVPDKTEKRWRKRLRDCENAFRGALSLTTERKSSALDYMPALRNITRSECARAANNTKRGNRFRNYLRDLGIQCDENTIKNSCRILNNT